MGVYLVVVVVGSWVCEKCVVLLIDGPEERKSSAVVIASGVAVQAFTSSVHVFRMARARNGLGGRSECSRRLGWMTSWAENASRVP